MKNTTLCYIEKDNKYLMLHRIKKNNDPNHNKWIGVGGKFERDESPDECIIRETREETGLTLVKPKLRGIVTFISNEWESEYMFVFTADNFKGEVIADCNEGNLAWVDKKKIMTLSLWEGDKIFLKYLLENKPFFLMKFVYQGDKLVKCVVNGEDLEKNR